MEDRKSIVPDFMKKAIQGSVRSLLSTEEGIRTVLREMLPRELFGYVKEVIDAGKSEGLRIVAEQTSEFLEKMDVETLAQLIVDNYRIKVNLEIELEPKEKKPGPKRKAAPRKKAKAKGAANHAAPGSDETHAA
jgi:hypothetical protein